MFNSVFKIIDGIIRIRGATDNTLIGNVGDRLKVTADIALVSDPTSCPTILKQAEQDVTTRTPSYVTGLIYTVPSGKSFKLTFFGGSFDNQGGVFLRLKKQTAGAGAFVTLFRVAIKQSPQEPATQYFAFPMGILVGAATDVFKIEYEASIARGSLWAGFTGVEY